MRRNNGFTFIEILVVVGIIILLAALSVSSYSKAIKKSRDGRRESDLRAIQQALEIYYSNESSYPPIAKVDFGGTWTGYMNEVPQDPQPTKYGYYYNPGVAGDTYELCAYKELETASAGCSGSCGTGVTCTFKLVNP